MASDAQSRQYYYKPPAPGPSSSSTAFSNAADETTFVLDQNSMALPARAQALLKSRGWFQSVSGVLFSHCDPRVAPAPLWVRLLAPTRTLVYTAQLAWLLGRFGAFLLPLLMLAVLGMDPLMKDAENRDGENAGGSSAHYAFVLSMAALSSDWLRDVLFDSGDIHAHLVDRATGTAAAAAAAAPDKRRDWLSYLFPVADSWAPLFCWPIGAALGLLLIQYCFPLCSSSRWVAIWNSIGLVAIGVYMAVVPGTYMVLTLCLVVSAFQHSGSGNNL
jgi:hypothetical protein